MLRAIKLLTAEQWRVLACHCQGSFVLYYCDAQWSKNWLLSPRLMLCIWGGESQDVKLLCGRKWGSSPMRSQDAPTWNRGLEHHNWMTWVFILELSDFRTNLWPEPESNDLFWLLCVYSLATELLVFEDTRRLHPSWARSSTLDLKKSVLSTFKKSITFFRNRKIIQQYYFFFFFFTCWFCFTQNTHSQEG